MNQLLFKSACIKVKYNFHFLIVLIDDFLDIFLLFEVNDTVFWTDLVSFNGFSYILALNFFINWSTNLGRVFSQPPETFRTLPLFNKNGFRLIYTTSFSLYFICATIFDGSPVYSSVPITRITSAYSRYCYTFSLW